MNDQRGADEFKKAGNKLYEEKKFDAAIEQYEKAIASEPDDFTSHSNKCTVLLAQERYAECERILKAFLQQRYDTDTARTTGSSSDRATEVMNCLARCYEKQLKYDDAIHTYETSLTTDENKSTRDALRAVQSAKEKADKQANRDVQKAEENINQGEDATVVHNLESQRTFVSRKRKAPQNLPQEATTIDEESCPAWLPASEKVTAFMEAHRIAGPFDGFLASSESEAETALPVPTTATRRGALSSLRTGSLVERHAKGEVQIDQPSVAS